MSTQPDSTQLSAQDMAGHLAALGAVAWYAYPGANEVHFQGDVDTLIGRESTHELTDPAEAISYVHEDYRDYFMAELMRAYEQNERVEFDYCIRKGKTGLPRWLRETANPMVDDDGNVVGLHGLIVDAHERITTENELKALRERHHKAMRATGVATWHWQIDDDVLETYVGLADISSGRPASEKACLQDWVSHLHPNDRDAAHRNMLRCAQGEAIEHRYRLPLADGGVRWLLTRGEPVEWHQDGAVACVAGTTVDVTAEMQAQAQVEKNLLRVEALVRTNSIASWEVDFVAQTLDYDSAGRRADVGAEAGPIPLEGLYQLLKPDDGQRVRQALMDAREHGQPVDLALQWTQHGTGRNISLHVVGNVTKDANGEVTGVTGVALDQTKIVELQAESERSKTLLENALRSVRACAISACLTSKRTQFTGDAQTILGAVPDKPPSRIDAVLQYVNTDDRPGLVQAIDDLKERGQPIDCLYRVPHLKTGATQWHHLYATPQRDESGQVTGLIGITVEVTEAETRRQAEAAQSQRYARATRAAGVGGWTWFVDSGVITLDAVLQDLFDIEPGEFNETVPEIMDKVADEDRRRVDREIGTGMVAGRSYEVRYRRKMRDGSLRWTVSRGEPVKFSADGAVVQVAGASWDIDDEVRAGHEAARVKKILLDALDATHAVVFTVEPEQQRLEFIGDARKVMGLPPGPPLTQLEDVFASVHADDLQILRDGMDRIMAGSEREEAYQRVPATESGRTGWQRVLARPRRDESGKVSGIIGITIDETEAVERRGELNALRQTYDHAMRSAGIGNWTITLEPFRIEYDDVMVRLLGIDLDTFDGKLETVLNFFVEEDRHLLADALQGGLQTGKQQEVRQRRVMPDGQLRWFCTRGAYVKRKDDGQVIKVAGATWDITEIAAANQALERSNRDLEDFAYIASHDLREPLRGIKNYSEFLAEDYASLLNNDGRRMLSGIGELAQRLDRLLGDLLHFSRVGRTELQAEMHDLGAILDDVLHTLEFVLDEKSVDVRVPAPLPTLRCDSVRVGELFRNLVTNAVKYNDKDEKWIEIGYADGAFYVRDNGIGIAAEHIDRIFKIFKRLHRRDAYGGGTGAGLTIAKQIAERHGGRLWLESSVGEGSTFYFTLGESSFDVRA